MSSPITPSGLVITDPAVHTSSCQTGVHETAEETVIYSALRKLGNDGTRTADERTREEEAAKEILTKLNSMDVDSQEFEALFEDFSTKVHQHAASEESEVIPLLVSSVFAEQRQAMGEAFLASQKITASRP